MKCEGIEKGAVPRMKISPGLTTVPYKSIEKDLTCRKSKEQQEQDKMTFHF